MSRSIKWELTKNCNLKCKHCFVGRVNYDKDLSIKENKKIVDILATKEISHIIFSSKEPFTYEYFLELIKYCTEKNIAISIVTNATLISDTFLRELYKCKVTSISISLEGVTAKSNDEVRGKGNFDKVIEVLNKFKKLNCSSKYNIPIALQNSLTTFNKDEIFQMHRFFKKYSIHSVNIGDISLVGNASNNSFLKLSNSQYEESMHKLIFQYSEVNNPTYNINFKNFTIYDLSFQIIIPGCSAYHGHYSVVSDGSFCRCIALKDLSNVETLDIYNGNILNKSNSNSDNTMKDYKKKYFKYKELGFCKTCIFNNKCELCLIICSTKNDLKNITCRCERL